MKHLLNVDHYVVAFIDVLGQSNKIMENSSYPPNEKERVNIKRNLEDTSDYILTLRDEFNTHFKKYRKLKDVLHGLSKNERKNVQRLNTPTVGLRGVSDSIIINVPLENRADKCIPVNNIIATIKGFCLLYNIALSNNKPVRGGIDVGWGTRLTQDEVYGSGLVKAYNLETKIAKYPRIVVGKDFLKYIDYACNLNSKTEADKKAKTFAQECRGLITKDEDNRYILDVIGKYSKKEIPTITPAMVQQGYNFIKQSELKFRKDKDTKLAPRYAMLKRYFDNNISIWGVK